MGDAVVRSEMKKAEKPVSSLESPGADWNSRRAHQKFCELLDCLRIQSESLFSLLQEEHISPNESSIPNRHSANIGSLESGDLTSSSSKTACENGSSKTELHNEGQPELVKSTEADNVESIFTDGNLVESYFRAYRVSLEQGRCPNGRRRPIVMDGCSCGTLVELLCGVRCFLREGHCVIALLPEKTFTRWCRNSLTSSECLLWMKLTGLLSPIAAEISAVKNANLVIDSKFNNVLLKLAYLTGAVLLSNRRLLSFGSSDKEWEKLAANRCLRFQMDNSRGGVSVYQNIGELQFAPFGRHYCTTLKWLLQFSSDSRVDVLVSLPEKSQLNEFIVRLEELLSRLGKELPKRVKRNLMCA